MLSFESYPRLQSEMLDLITVSGVEEYLEGTRFECSDALPLSGGTANFIYRISLLKPFEGHSTLILKHGRPFVGTIPFSLKRQVRSYPPFPSPH